MNTLIIICDSVATCVKRTAATCLPCVKNAEEYCCDVMIVGIICLTILLAIIVFAVYLKVKATERKTYEQSRQEPCGETSSNNKVRAEYISKLLKHLESLAIKEEAVKYDKAGSDRYIEVLKKLIETGTVTYDEQKA